MKAGRNASVQGEAGCEARPCAVAGCQSTAKYRAPRSRECLSDYIWLCLEHVRAYNKAWDYYAGMGVAEIEAHIRADTTWRRPSWPFGTGRPDGRVDLRDPFALFSGGRSSACGGARDGGERLVAVDPAERLALDVMDLSLPVTVERVKLRYKELVKQLHPDVNGGDKHAEERLKLVNDAYRTLGAARTL